jgi:hypothetical protein
VSHITEVLETRKKTGVNNVATAARSRCPHGDRARQQVPQTATKCVQQKYEVQRGRGPKAVESERNSIALHSAALCFRPTFAEESMI